MFSCYVPTEKAKKYILQRVNGHNSIDLNCIALRLYQKRQYHNFTKAFTASYLHTELMGIAMKSTETLGT